MEKMAEHQQTREQNITPNNYIEDQSRITDMCNCETSAKRMCNGEASAKEYAMAKHRLKDGKITWQRCQNLNKPKNKHHT